MPSAAAGIPAVSPEKEKEKDEAKLDRQIGLAGLLSALGIKASKLHNAGEGAEATCNRPG